MIDLSSLQLAQTAVDVQWLLASDPFVVQQKIDGHRVCVVVEDGKVSTFNRHMAPYKVMPNRMIDELGTLPGCWVLDGEYLGGHFYLFDILSTPKVVEMHAQPWIVRNRFLNHMFVESVQLRNCTVVPTVAGAAKVDFVDRCKAERLEGVVFKNSLSSYYQGRNADWLKYKFIKEIDVFVIDKGFQGRHNLVLGVYNEGSLVEVGRCSALTGDGPKAKVGHVLTVRFLYLSKDRRLVMPTMPRIRTDKLPEDCLYDQLEEFQTNKQIITP